MVLAFPALPLGTRISAALQQMQEFTIPRARS